VKKKRTGPPATPGGLAVYYDAPDTLSAVSTVHSRALSRDVASAGFIVFLRNFPVGTVFILQQLNRVLA